MLSTLFHVVLIVAALIGLLAVKQRRLRHIPTRRTHIPRRSAEGTIWLQRAVNAALDMLHCAIAEQNKSEASATGGVSSAHKEKDASSSPHVSPLDDDSGSDSDAEVPSDLPFLNTLKAQLEEQISALLEDKGIASFADFRIRDWGGKPPLVKAVCLSHGGGTGGFNSSNSSCSTSANGAGNPTNPVGGVAGGPSANNNNNNNSMDATLAGQRGGTAVGSGSSLTGSPNSLGPQLYPSFSGGGGGGGSSTLPPSVANRGAPLGSSSSSFPNSGNPAHPLNSPNPPPGDRGVGDGVSSGDAPYASMSLRYRNANPSLLSSGEEVGGAGGGRDRSLAGAIVHPGRMGGGNNSDNSVSAADLTGGLGSAAGAAGSVPPPPPLLPTGKHTSDTTRSLSVLEAEVEVEYSGNFSVSLNADVPIARGRYLQVYAAVSDVRAFAAHVRLRLALEYEPATVESPQPQPYLLGTLWLVSDPIFDVAFHTSLTQYRIRDFFLIPKLVKLFLLRFLRTRLRPSSASASASATAAAAAALRHTNARRRRQAGAAAAAAGGSGGASGSAQTGGAGLGTPEETTAAAAAAAAESERAPHDASGLSFRIPLPADVVDGGEHWWSTMARDTMSEQPAPFLHTYHHP